MSSYYLYIIKNTINKRCYVGITNDYINRFQEHQRGSKSNKILQQAFKKYGYNNFIFEIVIYGQKAEVIQLERLVVTKEDYNMTYGGGMPPVFFGDENPSKRPEVKEKISLSHKTRTYKPKSEEYKNLMKQYYIEGRLKKPRTRIYKKVKCLNDGLIFDNMLAAAKYYNVNRASVSRVANKLKPPSHCKGLDFEILETFVKWD